MRERGKLLKTKGAPTTFDRVGSTKDRVDRLFLWCALLKLQEAGFHCFQPFQALLKKDLAELGNINRHCAYPKTFLIVASSWSGLKGLTIQPVAPAALPSCFFSGADSFVSLSMGVNL